MGKCRFRQTPEVRMMWCPECRAYVTRPCIACQTRAAIATGLVTHRSDRGYEGQILEFDFQPEEAENYRAFRAEYPHGLGPLAEQVTLDNSVAVARITEEESWFVGTGRAGRPTIYKGVCDE